MWLLSVEANRLPRWYRPGLLLIGDAAHVASPVGGVGINLAIHDAVVAANVLTGPLKAGRVRLSALARVQRRREWPTRIMQAVQNLFQQQVTAGALDPSKPFRVPIFLRLPVLRTLPIWLFAFAAWPVHVKS